MSPSVVDNAPPPPPSSSSSSSSSSSLLSSSCRSGKRPAVATTTVLLHGPATAGRPIVLSMPPADRSIAITYLATSSRTPPQPPPANGNQRRSSAGGRRGGCCCCCCGNFRLTCSLCLFAVLLIGALVRGLARQRSSHPATPDIHLRVPPVLPSRDQIVHPAARVENAAAVVAAAATASSTAAWPTRAHPPSLFVPYAAGSGSSTILGGGLRSPVVPMTMTAAAATTKSTSRK